MTFSSQSDAKKFLANKIAFEAECQGAPLSDVEKRLLLFSEQEPGSEAGIPDDVLQDIDLEYEKKITSLLKAAYKRDHESPEMREQYEGAMQELDGNDHYLLVMAAPVLRPSVMTLPAPRQASDLFIYFAIGLAVVAGIVAYAIWQAN